LNALVSLILPAQRAVPDIPSNYAKTVEHIGQLNPSLPSILLSQVGGLKKRSKCPMPKRKTFGERQ